jgi:hypothetical protein
MAKRIDAEKLGAGTLLLVALALAIVAGLSTREPSDAEPPQSFSLAFAAPGHGVEGDTCRARTWVRAIVTLQPVPPTAADAYGRLAQCNRRDDGPPVA